MRRRRIVPVIICPVAVFILTIAVRVCRCSGQRIAGVNRPAQYAAQHPRIARAGPNTAIRRRRIVPFIGQAIAVVIDTVATIICHARMDRGICVIAVAADVNKAVWRRCIIAAARPVIRGAVCIAVCIPVKRVYIIKKAIAVSVNGGAARFRCVRMDAGITIVAVAAGLHIFCHCVGRV